MGAKLSTGLVLDTVTSCTQVEFRGSFSICSTELDV